MLKITRHGQRLEGNLRHPKRDRIKAMLRGAKMKCPSCGQGALFWKYLKTVETCGHCGEPLHYHRADDAPAYFTIFAVGHLVLPPVIALDMAFDLPMWLFLALWVPLTVLATIILLPMIKGAIVGLQWALYMHGFDPDERGKTDPHIDTELVEPSRELSRQAS